MPPPSLGFTHISQSRPAPRVYARNELVIFARRISVARDIRGQPSLSFSLFSFSSISHRLPSRSPVYRESVRRAADVPCNHDDYTAVRLILRKVRAGEGTSVKRDGRRMFLHELQRRRHSTVRARARSLRRLLVTMPAALPLSFLHGNGTR